jgi:hypothetical protein
MSRGSTTESAVSVSRGSSATRSRQESGSAPRIENDDDQHDKEGEGGKEGQGGGGLTAKVLSMLGKPISHTK